MTWRKLGRIYAPDGTAWWMRTHAASPIPLSGEDPQIRVLVSGRDDHSRARIGTLTFSLEDITDVTVADEPIADLGEPGTFDENGMVGGCSVVYGDERFIYYSGFQIGKTVPFWFFCGLLISADDARTARRYSRVPILDRTDSEPIIVGAPWIINDGGRWRMWYTAGTHWTNDDGALKHFYHIRYAESDDAIHWNRTDRVAIDFRAGEYAIGRPCVIRDPDRYRMWYSYRGSSYRIGYAESYDGQQWVRMDDAAGIDVSPDGWDSEMIEYAAVFDNGGRRWMLYNGNGFGRSGLGLAVLE